MRRSKKNLDEIELNIKTRKLYAFAVLIDMP